MALTPDCVRAVNEAISKIKAEAGNDPQYKDLLGKLEAVHADLGAPAAPTQERDHAEDDHSFETAQKRHTERTAANNAAVADTGTDGAAGGEGR